MDSFMNKIFNEYGPWSWFTQNEPFILKHNPLNVTAIVCGVPSIEFSVFIRVISLLSGHIILKGWRAVYLLSYMFANHML